MIPYLMIIQYLNVVTISSGYRIHPSTSTTPITILLPPSLFTHETKMDRIISPSDFHASADAYFSPHFEFTARLMLIYLAFSILVLFVFTLLHWASKVRSWRGRRKRAKAGGEETSFSKIAEATHGFGNGSSEASSSSSTLQDHLSAPKTLNPYPKSGEQSPLLPKTQQHPTQSKRRRVSRAIQAWLVYQPKPIPLVNKMLPSNGSSITILIFVGVQSFFTFYRVPLSIPMMLIFADRAGLFFAANLPILYIFAAKNQPIKLLTGYSYESLNIIHRRLGEVMCLLALLHSAGMVVVWYTLHRPYGEYFVSFILRQIILWGIGTFIVYELIYFTSLGSFRQRWYELFLGLHVSLQVFALIFLWFHHEGSRPYVYAALTIFIIDRVIYRMFLKTRRARAVLELKDDKATVVLSARVPTSEKGWRWSSLLSSNLTHGWKATEHVFLTVPALAPKHILQAHPFTIASKAPSLVDEDLYLELIIRAHNGFSRDLLQYSEGHKGVTVRLDGPYGSQSAVDMIQDSDIRIVVAGGSGIAVAWPLVWSAIDAQTDDDPEILAPSRSRKVLLVWIVRDLSHLDWVDPSKLDEVRTKGAEVQIPPPTAQNGHPDIENIISSYITTCAGSQSNHNPKVGIVCSGPDGLNRSVRNTCSALLYQGRDVSIGIEKFGW